MRRWTFWTQISPRAQRAISHSGVRYLAIDLVNRCGPVWVSLHFKSLVGDIDVAESPSSLLTIGPKPDAALYDADRGLAFIPSDFAVVGKVTTTPGARTIAEDPRPGKLYLPVAERRAYCRG